MSTLQERLRILMDEYQLEGMKDLAEFAGVSKGLVSQWFSGQTKLGEKALVAFDKKTNFSISWLQTGKGNRYKSEEPVFELQDALAIARTIEEAGRNGVSLETMAQKLGLELNQLQALLMGKEKVNLKFFADLIALGFDMNYILGGIRTPPARAELGNIYNVSQNDIQAVSVLGVDASGKE